MYKFYFYLYLFSQSSFLFFFFLNNISFDPFLGQCKQNYLVYEQLEYTRVGIIKYMLYYTHTTYVIHRCQIYFFFYLHCLALYLHAASFSLYNTDVFEPHSSPVQKSYLQMPCSEALIVLQQNQFGIKTSWYCTRTAEAKDDLATNRKHEYISSCFK